MSATEPRECAHCGRLFTPKRSDARFCSDACRAAANRTRTVSRTDKPHAVTDSRTSAVVALAEPLVWDPPSGPADPFQTDEPCPECGDRLWTRGRFTRRLCHPCGRLVVPPGVRAPYERGTAAVRQVKSQRERDLEAVALTKRKGIMLAQLAQLAADNRLHPESRPVVDWFTEAVKAATTDARLTELAELLPEAGIRRRGWWQRSPAAIAAEPYDGDETGDLDDDGDYDDGETDDQDFYGPPHAESAELRPINYPLSRTVSDSAVSADPAAALVVRGYTIRRDAPAGGCQISEHGGACMLQAAAVFGPARVCDLHLYALTGRTS